MAYEQMRDHIAARLGVGLGETTPDGRFTLLPIVCLGAVRPRPRRCRSTTTSTATSRPSDIDEILASYE